VVASTAAGIGQSLDWSQYWQDLKERRAQRRDARAKRRREREAERQIQRIERKQQRVLKKELKLAKKAILHRLTRLEFARWSSRKGRQQISQLKFAQGAATPSALYLRVDTVRMPRGRGITTDNLSDDEVLRELSLACGAPVRTYRHYKNGFWFVIERADGVGAIPHYVEYDEVLREMPKTAGPLDVPLGIGVNRRFYHVDITDMPHLLVAGATGFGKSVFLFNALLTVAQRTRPSYVKIVLVDLKGGAGLGPFARLPHLWDERTPNNDGSGDFIVMPRVYSRREEVIEVLKRLNYETERRFQTFQREKARDMNSYNRKHPNSRMPYILAVFDEIQNVMLDRKMKTDAERLLTDIASRSRAAGIHLIVATQRPSADVITGLIKANFPARLAFTTATAVDSRVILGNTGAAANLGRPGLLLYQSELKRIKCQCPFVSEALVDDVVDKLAAGDYTVEVNNSVGTMDMVRWALEENDGKFTIDDIYKQFRPRGVTYDDAKLTMGRVIEMVEIEVDGDFYRWRRRDSKLIRVDEDSGSFVDVVEFKEVASWALAENNGKLTHSTVFNAFKDRLTQTQLTDLLSEHENQDIELDGVVYVVDPGGGPVPRNLVPKEEHD
jgi:hypothetical protein